MPGPVPTAVNCNFKDDSFSVDVNNFIACFEQEGDVKSKFQCLCPSSYQSEIEHCGGSYTATELSCNADCRDCMEKTVGVGIPCTFESKVNGAYNSDTYKYHKTLGWGESCSYLQEKAENNLIIKELASACDYNDSNICYQDDGSQQFICKCPSNYKTLVDF